MDNEILNHTDVLELRLMNYDELNDEYMEDEESDWLKNNKFVDIIINGVPLLDTIKQIETEYCQQEDCPELAGDYGHNTAEYMKKQLTEALLPDTYNYDYGVELYCCSSCGIGGCWSVCCIFRETDGLIEMKGFKHNHRKDWVYNLHYRFSKENFYNELNKL
ncbi:MAG: hypothetical protein K2K89_10085 [Ruminococcus sp.]|nr:hypothetical protein [Ruminococcus sp.]